MTDRLPQIRADLAAMATAQVIFTVHRSDDGERGSITISEGPFEQVRMAAKFLVHTHDMFNWLIAELEASRTAGDQLRAILDDLLPYARAGVGNHPDASYRNREVDRLASQAIRLLGAIRSPDDAAHVAGGGGSR